MLSLIVDPTKFPEDVTSWFGAAENDSVLTIDLYKAERSETDLWLLTIPKGKIEEIGSSDSLHSRFVAILNHWFEWSTSFILDFIRQSGRLYEITLSDESTFYYAWHSDVLQSSIKPWVLEKAPKERDEE